MIGKRFGAWVVLRAVPQRAGGHVAWYCQCECGKTGIVSGDILRLGRSKSCGCLKRDLSRERMRKANPNTRRADKPEVSFPVTNAILTSMHQ